MGGVSSKGVTIIFEGGSGLPPGGSPGEVIKVSAGGTGWSPDAISASGTAVDSVFARGGNVVAVTGDYNAGHITETSLYKIMTSAERAKLATIASSAQVNTVDTVFTRSGAIVAATGDYNAGQITETSLYKILTSAERVAITSAVPNSRTVGGELSVSGGGALTGDLLLSLVNDAASPGTDRYYGTNAAGTKGFHPIPVTGGSVAGSGLVLVKDVNGVVVTASAMTFTGNLVVVTSAAGQQASVEVSGAKSAITLAGEQSISGGGNLTANRLFSLVGDSDAPGASKYYGTDSNSTKGFFALPASGSTEATLFLVKGTNVIVTASSISFAGNSVIVTTAAGQNATVTINTVPSTRSIAGEFSVSGGGDFNANRLLSLVGDSASPGNSMYYGTDASGTRGFYDATSRLILSGSNVVVTASAVTFTGNAVVVTTAAGQNATVAINAVPSSRSIAGELSISGGGDLNLNRLLSLVNDSASPGASQYYGTNVSGNKGYFSLPSQAASTIIARGPGVLVTASAFTFSGGLLTATTAAGGNITIDVSSGGIFFTDADVGMVVGTVETTATAAITPNVNNASIIKIAVTAATVTINAPGGISGSGEVQKILEVRQASSDTTTIVVSGYADYGGGVAPALVLTSAETARYSIRTSNSGATWSFDGDPDYRGWAIKVPVSGDYVLVADSADGYKLKRSHVGTITSSVATSAGGEADAIRTVRLKGTESIADTSAIRTALASLATSAGAEGALLLRGRFMIGNNTDASGITMPTMQRLFIAADGWAELYKGSTTTAAAYTLLTRTSLPVSGSKQELYIDGPMTLTGDWTTILAYISSNRLTTLNGYKRLVIRNVIGRYASDMGITGNDNEEMDVLDSVVYGCARDLVNVSNCGQVRVLRNDLHDGGDDCVGFNLSSVNTAQSQIVGDFTFAHNRFGNVNGVKVLGGNNVIIRDNIAKAAHHYCVQLGKSTVFDEGSRAIRNIDISNNIFRDLIPQSILGGGTINTYIDIGTNETTKKIFVKNNILDSKTTGASVSFASLQLGDGFSTRSEHRLFTVNGYTNPTVTLDQGVHKGIRIETFQAFDLTNNIVEDNIINGLSTTEAMDDYNLWYSPTTSINVTSQASVSEFNASGLQRLTIASELYRYERGRLEVYISGQPGKAGVSLGLQVSQDSGTTWTTLGTNIQMDGAATSYLQSYFTIPTSLKYSGDTKLFRMVHGSGNDTSAMSISQIGLRLACGSVCNVSDKFIKVPTSTKQAMSSEVVFSYSPRDIAEMTQYPYVVPLSNLTAVITADTSVKKNYLTLPFNYNIVGLPVACLDVAQSGGSLFTVDIRKATTSVLSTLLTIDNSEMCSNTAVTPAVVADASVAAYTPLNFYITTVGDGTARGAAVAVTVRKV